ncbi:MAG: 3-deoxy-7-phosphoheptulonate synthase [Nitrospirae bacterium CG08_land_8_20_14_0_20_52_24]|nr:MAG: 3-deoxy-7-phosphoheptulonate synthase [Nitrospirae bacterium CG2_30_53_67]PIS37157.1 MAG: 3-deoxy-7-phosphoheptulonate synthase [Nitrospirae bacterium CG08_land_8_20_14_0_20_52_24]
MIIVMQADATAEQLEHVIKKIEDLGYRPHVMHGVERNVIGAIGDERGKARLQVIESMAGVESVVPILKPYKLASLEVRKERTVIEVKGASIGGQDLMVIAGPCSVESEEQILASARAVKEAGANVFRGGAFKPRTSPYAFQGMGEEGLKLLAAAREATGLPIITEVMNPRDLDLIVKYTDIIQIGARNVQNFALLKEVGQTQKPVLLKRGMATTLQELLMSAEYILSEGNEDVILCERGIRTFETATRNTLDLSCIPVLKRMSHLPIVIDPSHAVGNWQYVPAMARAAVAAGADGLMIEVHPNPEEALSDGPQSLKPDRFKKLMEDLVPFVEASGKNMPDQRA